MVKITIRFLTIFLALLLANQAVSQQSPIRLGLKIAPSLGWMNPNETGYNYNGPKAGVSFGFICDFGFAEHYAFSTGFNFSFLGGNLSYPNAEAPDTGILDRNYSFRYLEIPLMIKMKTREYGNFSFYGQIGFGTGFNLRTKVKDDFRTSTQETITDKKNLSASEVSFIREAILAGLGAEYKIDESVSLLLGISYSNSLNNVLQGKNTKDPTLTNRSSLNYVELNIGVLF
ncbi:MAG: porin family protein [Bacteroidetes bacterium]|nr:porin family protein [Bacteroidota bacterium]